MLLGSQQLQFGAAAACQHPLLSLLAPQQPKGQQISKFGHPTAVTALVWSEHRLLVSADAEGRVKLWVLSDGPPLAALRLVAAHLLHSGAVTCLQLHQPTSLLATAGNDGAVRLWNLSELARCKPGRHSAAQLACLTGHAGGITACCFSDCGAFLASASALDGTVRLWSTGARETLAVLQLQASSMAFAPGNAAALLVAASAAGQGPQLLDLRQVPACTHYCTQATANQRLALGSGACGSSGGGAGDPDPAAMHPAAMAPVWLPAHDRQQAVPAVAAAATALSLQCHQVQGAGAAETDAPSVAGMQHRPGSPQRRQAGSLVAFSRKRRRQEQQQQQQKFEAGTKATAATPGSSRRSSPRSWLPGGDSALFLPGAASCARTGSAGGGGSSLFGWSAPLSPSSPLAAAEQEDRGHGSIPAAAVVARFEAPSASSSGGSVGSCGGDWDPAQRCFVYRQGGHSCPVRWLLPLPAGLHALTVATDGEAKLWRTGGSRSSSRSSSAEASICCTLLPAEGDRRECPLGCRPAMSSCGRYVVCGRPSGTLACWDLQQLQRQAHLPLSSKSGNAAAACVGAHQTAVTAVAVGEADTLVASGDAGGRLVVRWV